MADSGKIDAEALLELGRVAGYTFAAIWQGFKEGCAEFALVAAAMDVEAQAEAVERAEPPIKTQIADCRRCWCDQCQHIEDCPQWSEGSGPCDGCSDGVRQYPIEGEACEDYAPGGAPNHG